MAELGAAWATTCKRAVRGYVDALLPSDPLQPDTLELDASYASAIVEQQGGEAQVGIAVGPVQLATTYRQDRTETRTGDLSIRARYRAKEPLPTLEPVPDA